MSAIVERLRAAIKTYADARGWAGSVPPPIVADKAWVAMQLEVNAVAAEIDRLTRALDDASIAEGSARGCIKRIAATLGVDPADLTEVSHGVDRLTRRNKELERIVKEEYGPRID